MWTTVHVWLMRGREMLSDSIVYQRYTILLYLWTIETHNLTPDKKSIFFSIHLFTTPSFIFFKIASPTSSSLPLIGAVSMYLYPRSIASLTACSIIPFPVSCYGYINNFSLFFCSTFHWFMIFWTYTPTPCGEPEHRNLSSII